MSLRSFPWRWASVACALVLAACGAHGAAAQGPAARREAIAGGFQDADMEWLRPLMQAQLADAGVTAAQAVASATTLQRQMTAAPERAARIARGEENVLDDLRRESAWLLLPPGAAYDAACTAALVQHGTLGTGREAVLALPAGYAAASAWYRARDRGARGPSVAYNDHVTKVQTPDAWLEIWVHSSNTLARQYPGCRGFSGGAYLQVMDTRGAGALTRAAGGAPPTAPGAHLPAALRRAGLSASDWDAVQSAMRRAATDGRIAADAPGMMSTYSGAPAAVARRRADVAWFLRHRAELDAYEEALLASATSR